MTDLMAGDRPRLASHIRLKFDSARDQHVLLSPEAISMLNGTGAAILQLCDGSRSIGEIEAQLKQQYREIGPDDVRSFLTQLLATRTIEIDHE